MTKYNKTVLTIYFILGLPALPIALVMLLMQRYIMGDEGVFKPENREDFIYLTCTYMITFTLFALLPMLLAFSCAGK